MFLRFHRIWALSLAILISAFVSASSAWAVDASITNVQDAEEGVTNGRFVITLDGTVTGDTTINFTVSGTATDTTDYVISPTNSVTIAGGLDNATIDIAVDSITDTTVERDETVIITITASDNPDVDIGPTNVATMTITDNDDANVSVTTLANLAEDATDGRVEFTSTNTSDEAIVITYSVAGTATSGSDFSTPDNTATIAIGGTTVTEDFEVLPDDVPEGLETIIVTITDVSHPRGVINSDNFSDNLTITSIDTADISVINGTNGSEDGVNSTFIFNISPASSVPIDVDYTFTGTAVAGVDYNAASSGTHTIPANVTTHQLSIPILNDTDNDPNQTIIITLDSVSTGPGVIVSPDNATNTIQDNDQVIVSISPGSNGSESAEDNVTFTVSLDQPAPSTFNVYFTPDGTADAVTDYGAVPCCMITFAGGQQTETLEYTVIDDDIAEGTETITITLDNATGVGSIGSQNTASRLITDNDTAVITVNPTTVTGDEPTATAAEFTIETSNQASYPITASFVISGTATAGSDFTSPSPTSVTIPANTLSTTVDISILDDAVAEDNETIILSLDRITSGSALIGSDNSATAIVTDNDTVTVTILSSTDTDEDNATSGSFRVGLSAIAETDITANFTVLPLLPDGAIEGTDYQNVGTSITIPRGEISADVTITPIDDNISEAMESIEMTLVSADLPGVISSPPPESLSITDNDDATITIIEGDNGTEDGDNATFIISTTADAHSGYTIGYAISGDVESSDYSIAQTGTFSFASGDNMTFGIPITDDNFFEDNETLTVTLTSVTGDAVLSSDDSASVIVTNNDITEINIANTDNSSEAGPVDGTLTITLDNATTVPVTVNYSVTDNATPDEDYVELSGTVNFEIGATSKTITIDVIDDNIYEDNETITITLDNVTGPVNIGSSNTAVNTLVSDDNAMVSVALTSNAEEDGPVNGVFTLTLSQAVDQDVTVNYHFDNASSTTDNATDYTNSIYGSAVISTGTTTETISLVPIDDTNAEGDETVVIVLDNVSAGPAEIGTSTATMILVDDDATIVSVSALDNGTEGSDNASFLITLSSTSTDEIDITYTLSGTANDDIDYDALDNESASLTDTITIDNNSDNTTIFIAITDDTIDEDNETVIFTINSVTGSGAYKSLVDDSAEVIIIDNDNSSIEVSAPSSVNEGQTASFTVTLTAASSTDTTITYSDNGTATSGTDYTAPSGSLVIEAGETSGTIDIAVLTDDVTDDGETLSITLTAVSGMGSLASTPTASTTINDVTDVEKELREAVIATRKMIREDLATSLDDTRRTATNLIRGAVNRLSDENSHDYTEHCEDDGKPNGDIKVEGNDQAIEGFGKYNKTDRKCFTNDVSIASVDVAITDDGDGAETLNMNTVYASETTSDDLYSKYGYYFELSVRNREQTKDKGEIDTIRVNIGSYLIYRSAAQTYLSSYITFGASSSDYELTHNNVQASGNFMAYNMGTGLGFTGEARSRYVKFQPSFNLDLFATGYQSFDGDFKLNGTTYKRQIDQSILHKATLSISPVINFYSSSNFAEANSVTTVAPSIFCTNGSFETDCGFSLMVENISRNILGSDLTTKLSYESIGDTSTTALSLNATTHLFGNKFIKMSNKVTAKQADTSTSSSASTSGDVDVSYKVFIEMLY